MLGSAVATDVCVDYAYALKDREGQILREELEKIAFWETGRALSGEVAPSRISGVPRGAGPDSRRQRLRGGRRNRGSRDLMAGSHDCRQSAHAGATPMGLRADAGLAASRINVKLREMIASGNTATCAHDGLRQRGRFADNRESLP